MAKSRVSAGSSFRGQIMVNDLLTLGLHTGRLRSMARTGHVNFNPAHPSRGVFVAAPAINSSAVVGTVPPLACSTSSFLFLWLLQTPLVRRAPWGFFLGFQRLDGHAIRHSATLSYWNISVMRQIERSRPTFRPTPLLDLGEGTVPPLVCSWCDVASSTSPPPIGPRRGFFMQHPLWPQLLHAWKVAEMAGLAVLTRRQQAQGKHGTKCRGIQPEIVDW
jgi:hypothetical protein